MKHTLVQFIDEFRTHFKKLPPEDIAYPRSVVIILKSILQQKTYIKSQHQFM